MIVWYWSVKGGVGTSVVSAATAVRLASEGQDATLVDLIGDQPSLLGVVSGGLPDAEPGIGDWVSAGEDVAADAIGRLAEGVAPNLRLLRNGTVPIPVGGSCAGSGMPAGARTSPSTGGRTDAGGGARRLMLGLEVLAQSGPVVVDAGLDRHQLRSCLADGGTPVCVLRACFLALSRAQQVLGPYDRIVLVEEPGRALRHSDVAHAVGSSHVERIAWDPRVARSVDAGTIVSSLPPPLRRFGLPS